MLGTIVNATAIIVGCVLGLLLKGGLPEKVGTTVMKGLSLCTFFIGINGIIENSKKLSSNDFMLIIISIVLGSVIGELIDFDKRLNNLGNRIETMLKGKGGKVAEGFVTASLLYCVGAMAIVGSLQSGLTGDHKTLFAKSILDGVSAIVFASTLGIGVIFSAISVFVYQGTITLAASAVKSVLVSSVVCNMTVIGSLLIIGISVNLMCEGKIQVKVANILPAVLIPIFYYLFCLVI